MAKTKNAYPIEKKAEQLLDEIRLAIRKSVRILAKESVRVVNWLTKPSKNMADVLEKIAFLFLLASIIFRSRGW